MKKWHVPAGANVIIIGKRYLGRAPIVLAIWMANLVACNSVGHSGTTSSVVATATGDANSLDGFAGGAATVDANSLDGCVGDFTTIDIDANSLFGPSDAADGACATAQDCYKGRGSDTETLFCCVEGTCAYSEGTDILPCTDANVQLIQASNYDQSCRTASDCILVAEGNFCQSAGCPNAAINIGAYAQYQADVAKTNAAICGGISGCLGLAGVCCQDGMCQVR
jgi:hypothetical protein